MAIISHLTFNIKLLWVFYEKNTKYSVGRYFSNTIKVVTCKGLSRFNTLNVETHAKCVCLQNQEATVQVAQSKRTETKLYLGQFQ